MGEVGKEKKIKGRYFLVLKNLAGCTGSYPAILNRRPEVAYMARHVIGDREQSYLARTMVAQGLVKRAVSNTIAVQFIMQYEGKG